MTPSPKIASSSEPRILTNSADLKDSGDLMSRLVPSDLITHQNLIDIRSGEKLLVHLGVKRSLFGLQTENLPSNFRRKRHSSENATFFHCSAVSPSLFTPFDSVWGTFDRAIAADRPFSLCFWKFDDQSQQKLTFGLKNCWNQPGVVLELRRACFWWVSDFLPILELWTS